MKHAPSVLFLPYGAGQNPHLEQLTNSLESEGVRIHRVAKALFLFEVLRRGPDILHLHWIHPLIMTSGRPYRSLAKTLTYVIQLILLRALGVKLVWTIHNLENHEREFLVLDRICSFLTAHLVHANIGHCETARQEIKHTYRLGNDRSIHVIPYGHYIDYYPNDVGQEEARRQLDLDRSVLAVLFLGHIRPYKGLPELVDAFGSLETRKARLIIAGGARDERETRRLRSRVESHTNINLFDRFIGPDEMDVFMNAADVVALPYRDILNSGALILAMSFAKPCVAPRLGCIRDVLREEGGFPYDPSEPNGLKKALENALNSRDKLERMGEFNFRRVKEFDWSRIGGQTRRLYTRILEGKV